MIIMILNKSIRVSNNYGCFRSKSSMNFELAVFCRKFIEFVFTYFNIEQTIFEEGRPPFNLIDVISLLVFGNVNGITSSVVIAEHSEFHELYQFVSNNLIIADRTLRKYRSDYKELFEKILSLTLILAYYLSITDFKHIALDGTILKAFNSPFNILKMEDINTLINHYAIKKLKQDEIKELRLSAIKFIESKSLNDNEKLSVLKTLKNILEESEQSSIGINDITARWMYNKQHRAQLSYNLQHGVDTKSILICGINVSQSPTDHYEIPALMEKVLKNLNGIKPEIVSADTIYRTIINLTYLKEEEITILTPTRKQGKESINHLNANPFSSDYFQFDPINDIVICPNKKELKKYGPYACKPDKFGFQREQYAYSNYEACKQCKDREACCNGGHRTITRYNHELLNQAEELMEIEENKKEYKQRNKVEAPNGTYKTYYHINELPLVGIENIQGIMNEIGASYNMKRLFNIFIEKNIDLNDVYKVMEILTAPSSNFLCNGGLFTQKMNKF